MSVLAWALFTAVRIRQSDSEGWQAGRLAPRQAAGGKRRDVRRSFVNGLRLAEVVVVVWCLCNINM